MTPKQFVELCGRAGTPVPQGYEKPDASKFNSRKKELDGHTFDSTGEAEAYRYLKRDEACGIISKLELQPRFILQDAFKDSSGLRHRAIEYVADFRFLDINGDSEIVDYKGFRTPVYKIKLKMLRAKYPDLKFTEWDRETLKALRGR